MTKIPSIEERFVANYLDGDKIQDGQMLSSRECLDAITAEREAGARAEAEWWSNHAQKLSAAIESSKDIVDAERLGLKYAKKHVARLKALTPPTN